MTIYKGYEYRSRYQLPYKRLHTFESKLEYPLPSENLALTHLRSNIPKGFWNHGVLGELMARRTNNLMLLPCTPLGEAHHEIIKLQSSNSKLRTLHVLISFYEGLDEIDLFKRQIKQLQDKFYLKSLAMSLDYIPLSGREEHHQGVEVLISALAKEFNLDFISLQEFKGKTYSQGEYFTHLHNKIFHYYSVHEIRARMNGADILYFHPTQDFPTEEIDHYFDFLETTNKISLHQLQLMLRLSTGLRFQVNYE